MREAHRHDHEGGAYQGLTRVGSRGVDWNGVVRLVPDMLGAPARWRKPQRIFVNSMSDLFHESLPDEAIDRVFGAMASEPRHTFQILTKRPERMLDYLRPSSGAVPRIVALVARHDQALAVHIQVGIRLDDKPAKPRWPLPNVWLGTSVEDQATADERIQLLLQTPAAVRFISLEPQLAHVDLASLDGGGGYRYNALLRGRPFGHHEHDARLDWVIVGGESGPGARPFDVAWARSTVAQCTAAGVPVFVKQLGSRWARRQNIGRDASLQKLRNSKGGDPEEWPADLRVRAFPEGR